MKIAIIGIRGIPVIYSAFETFAHVLSTELVKKNHDVTVYARQGMVSEKLQKYRGVTIMTLPHISGKNTTTFSHSLLATVHACLLGKYDLILYLGPGNALFSIIPRLRGMKTIVHIDGMDWKREKWGRVGKAYLRFSEYLTTFLPNAVITDSHYMIDYYKKTYKKNIHYIPYGYFEVPKHLDAKKILEKYHLVKGKYFVWVGRFVPENHIEDFLTAFTKLKDAGIKCIILGDDLYECAYKKKIYSLINQDKRIIFKGFIKHEEVLALEANSLAYIETKRSGGTHMSLVEAMGVGALIISHTNQANKDVLGNGAVFYTNAKKSTSLVPLLHNIMVQPNKYSDMKKLVKVRAKQLYEWGTIIKQYEKLFSFVLQ